MGEVSGEHSGVVAEILAGSGSAVVSSEAPAELASALVDALDAELVEDASGLADALERRRAQVDRRTRALAALELAARLDADVDLRHVVTDLPSLRRLAQRVARAVEFVDESRAGLRDRLSRSTDVAVHPETIRKAAAEVTEARAALQAAEVAVEELRAVTPAPSDPADAPAGPRGPGWDPDARRTAVRAGTGVVTAVVVSFAALVVTGSPVPLVLPVLALGWAVLVVVRHRADVVDRDVASDNLAAVSALTDRAYGGVALSEPEELVVARRAVASAQERLRYAESAWTGLVGTGVDVGSVEEVVSARDPRWHVGDDELDRTPTLRAAEAHARRLAAQWKLAWWALDRPVPPVDDADASLDRLEAEGVEEVTVDTWAARSPERVEDTARLEELAEGWTIDELRVVAGEEPVALVVLDEAGEITAADLSARTAALPAGARVVVVVPAVAAARAGEID